MKLAVDIGNTKSKIGVFKGDEIILSKSFSPLTKKDILREIKSIDEKIERVIVSSVGAYSKELELFFTNCFKQYLVLSPEVKLPFSSKYATPETLGPDRMAAAAGAMELFEGKNVLAIDAGSCITYDFLDQNLTYYGGGISPGLNMRFKAMHNFTGKLPLILSGDQKEVRLIGNSTESSMVSGVINGMTYEINGMIEQYEKEFGKLEVVLTGGDYKVFEKRLKKSIFADPNLVLKGLNKILSFNIEE